ncbi:hypothetical protein GGR52DRAFT_91384 [Hypoxylon sp. FL1284]|nr:hypothetical protein GGR52DRAFT_91384 [Hypoxylon sp. FL1284]
MFLVQPAMLMVALTAFFNLTAATPLASAGAQVSTDASENMQATATLGMPAINHLKSRDDAVHGCYKPTAELGPAPSVDDCNGAIDQVRARQGTITIMPELGCVTVKSGNCTASVCPHLMPGSVSSVSPSEAAQYLSDTVLPECIAKGLRGWYMNRNNAVGVYLN